MAVEGPRVVVVGSLNMDLVVRVPRLPRGGETIFGEDLLFAPGGKGANQAVAAARLGAEVSLVGRVGRDAFGHQLTSSLREAGVATRWVLGSERPTGAALIEVDEHGENSIVVAPGANLEVLPEDIPTRLVAEADMVVAPLEVPLASIEEAFRLARLTRHSGSAGIRAVARTVLNASPARPVPESLLRLADVIIVNEHEAALLLGRSEVTEDDAVDAAAALRVFPEQVVVITLGARGAVGVSATEVVRQASFPADVVDSTGAGDAFVGGFVVGRWYAKGLAVALRLGCAAGALACTRVGAQPSLPNWSEVESLLSAHPQ